MFLQDLAGSATHGIAADCITNFGQVLDFPCTCLFRRLSTVEA
jgi:hypothetical protein